ncbi:MAG: DUF4783 domain-containing protein [Chitinophagales bacterium]|nr:DUF4783 domain-containing protein [Bacteroidota bacterium]MBP7399479.1 DUF4783 domain-containing protein [Chitinophagales bacterium]MBK8487032.1 DUF4783 domain-containing protein [Bacteroidota bacterium]MBK8680421.1 DUF4783 domain-containing protein [Bacteroidota bacterium]MBP9190716.1 DUF4783 domain-containing protein [Chitinophagales bacterium]
MKNHINKNLLVFLLVPLLIMATTASNLDSIAQAIRTGNAKELASFFDTTIEIKINDKEGAYSKAQAEQVVKDFFVKNPPKGFSFMHDGESGGSAYYAIGSLTTANGKFRTYVYLKKKGESYLIQELSFENE